METNSKPVSLADQMRAALKTAGYSRKQVTVKHDHYSMGSTVHVTIRDHKISKAKIEAICESYQNVRYDSYSGEILSGGNTFVRVEYGRGVLEYIARPIADQLAAAAIGVPVEVCGEMYVKIADGCYGGSVIQDVDSDGIGGGRMNAHCGKPDQADELMFAARQIAERAIEVADLAEARELADRASDLDETEDADVIKFLHAVGAV